MDWPTAVVLFPSRYRGDGGADYLHQWSFLDEGLRNIGNHNETRDTVGPIIPSGCRILYWPSVVRT
jgi:hypothetical protein